MNKHGYIRVTNPTTQTVMWVRMQSIESIENARNFDGCVLTLTPSGVVLHVAENVHGILEQLEAPEPRHE